MTDKDFQNKRIQFKEGKTISQIITYNQEKYFNSHIINDSIKWSKDEIKFFYNPTWLKKGEWITLYKTNIKIIKIV